MPNGTYGGVRGRKTKVGRKLLRFPPTRLSIPYYIYVRVMRGENLVSNTKLVDFALNTALTSSPIRDPHGINFVYASCDLLLNLR